MALRVGTAQHQRHVGNWVGVVEDQRAITLVAGPHLSVEYGRGACSTVGVAAVPVKLCQKRGDGDTC